MLMTAKGYKIYTSIPGFMADGGKSPKPLLLSVLRYTKRGVDGYQAISGGAATEFSLHREMWVYSANNTI